MAGKSVAVEGDVIATSAPETDLFAGANSGKWTAPPVLEEAYDTLTVGEKKVIYKAECTFLFAGVNASGSPVTGSETVTLEAKQKSVQKSQKNVLVDGDSQSGEKHSNKLEVKASNKLFTA